MPLSAKGLQFLKEKEAFRDKAYQDNAGKWTIGYGHTGNVHPGMKITKEAAEQLLRQDLERFENRVNRHVKVPLNPNQYDALVLFDYNTGGLLGSQLLNHLNQGNYEHAFNVELPKWNKVTDPNTGQKKVLRGLQNRRLFEQQLANAPFNNQENQVI